MLDRSPSGLHKGELCLKILKKLNSIKNHTLIDKNNRKNQLQS